MKKNKTHKAFPQAAVNLLMALSYDSRDNILYFDC